LQGRTDADVVYQFGRIGIGDEQPEGFADALARLRDGSASLSILRRRDLVCG
jgi:hypothetical protein